MIKRGVLILRGIMAAVPRRLNILLAAVILLALATPWTTGCHLIFRYEDRPPEAGALDSRADGPTPRPDKKNDGPRDAGAGPDEGLHDTRPPQCTGSNPCDDGDPCTRDDKCAAGVCKGVAYTCSDGLTCTMDVCDGKGGCDHTKVLSTHCVSEDKKSCQLKGTSRSDCKECEGGGKWTMRYPCVSTLTGSTGSFANGSLKNAKFNYPQGISVDSKGIIYVADLNNHMLRKISGGVVSTYAGDSAYASTGAKKGGLLDGAHDKARFNFPEDVDVHGGYAMGVVADTMNNTLRLVRSGWVQSAKMSSTEAEFVVSYPSGIAVHQTAANKKVTFYFTSNDKHRIYTGVCDKDTIAGCTGGVLAGTAGSGLWDNTKASAKFKMPRGVAVDSGGKVYVADFGNHAVRKISGTHVSTLAGLGNSGYVNGPNTKALFKDPEDVVVDSAGVVYVADSGNNAIRKISGTTVSTVAGGNGVGSVDGHGPKAKFYYPAGVAIQGTKTLYVADRNNHRIRLITLSP